MKFNPSDLDLYPDPMSKKQFCKLCHVSMLTADFYLQANLIPFTYTGKNTKCYKIRKEDVIQFSKDYFANPKRYTPPEGWYLFEGKIPSSRFQPLPYSLIPMAERPERARAYYEKKLKNYPDVVSVADIAQITGYDRRTIGQWVRSKHLKAIRIGMKYMIPQIFLLDWLSSDEFNEKSRKSKKHLLAMIEMGRIKKD